MRKRSFLGIILIAVGVGFLLEQFQIITFSQVFSTYWPSILILIGLSGLFTRKTSKFGDILLIVLGSLMQIDRLNLIDMNVYKLFWPIILILVGIQIILSRNSITIDTKKNVNVNKEFNYNGREFTKNITRENDINEFALLSGIETNNQSQEFRGGRATAIMGGIVIDLRSAKLYNNEAIIDLNTVMGGIEIYVPDDWRVEVNGTPILGGWSNKTVQNPDPNAPVLRVKCFVMFGGVEIK